MVAEESRHITTFVTDEGIFRCKRWIYGITILFESFQNPIELVIHGFKSVKTLAMIYSYGGKHKLIMIKI